MIGVMGMSIPRIKRIFNFRWTQDQASSWNVFVEHLNGARANDAWQSVVDAWIDGSLLRWLERQRPDTVARGKGLGAVGEPPIVKARQEERAAALFSDSLADEKRLKWNEMVARAIVAARILKVFPV